ASNDWFFVLLLAPVQPKAQFSKVLKIILRNRIRLESLVRRQPDELLDVFIPEPGPQVRVRKASVIPVMHVKLPCSVGLLENHQPAIEPTYRVMSIANCPRDLVQGDPVLVMHTGYILSLGNGIPVLWAINVLEANILPDVLPSAFDHGQGVKFL